MTSTLTGQGKGKNEMLCGVEGMEGGRVASVLDVQSSNLFLLKKTGFAP